MDPCEFAENTHYYTFVSWNVLRTDVYYTDGQVITIPTSSSDTLTLNAVWERTSYTLEFNSGEDPREDPETEWVVTGSMANQERLVGDGLAISTCTFVPPEGVVFDHWLVDYGDDETAGFAPNSTETVTFVHGSAPKVTAVWRVAEQE